VKCKKCVVELQDSVDALPSPGSDPFPTLELEA
jgi:hypothetical protein